MRVRSSFVTLAAPETVFDAYTEFGARRLELWRDTLRPEDFELIDRGDDWAVVREGSLRMAVIQRYSWSVGDPRSVRWDMLESSFCRDGRGALRIRPDGVGSRVDIDIVETGGKGLRGRSILLVKGLLGPVVLTTATRRTLDRLG